MNRTARLVLSATTLLVFSSFASASAAEIKLKAADASISGGAGYYADGDFIGAWTDPHARLQWDLTLDAATTAKVELNHSCAAGNGGKFVLTIGQERLAGETRPTGDWYTYQSMDLGASQAGRGPSRRDPPGRPLPPCRDEREVHSPLAGNRERQTHSSSRGPTFRCRRPSSCRTSIRQAAVGWQTGPSSGITAPIPT